MRPFSSKGDISSASWLAVPSQLRQVEAEVLCLLDCGVERGETEPADHIVPAITARDRICAAMAR